MSVEIVLEHHTTYDFARPVTLAPQVVRLRPAAHCRTPVRAFGLDVAPARHRVEWRRDRLGNRWARVVLPGRVRHLAVTARLVADLGAVPPAVVPALPAELTAAVHRAVAPARPGAVVQPPEQTLARGAGSCGDAAWLLVTLLRRHGLAARFVVGHLVRLGPAQDAVERHAWAEVHVPGAGWTGLDPTTGVPAGPGHLPLSVSAWPHAAAPVEGAAEPVGVRFASRATVRRLRPARVPTPAPCQGVPVPLTVPSRSCP